MEHSIVRVYEDVLCGKIKKFPHGTWKDKNIATYVLKYLIEEKLRWTHDDIRDNINNHFFVKHKLSGMLQTTFGGSPFSAINELYRNTFKPWELRNSPMNTWTTETCIEATKWLIEEKLQWSNEELKEKLHIHIFHKHGLRGMLQQAFHGSPYAAINTAYPERFKPWELKCTPMGYWTKDTSIEAIKWLIEEKLKWSVNDIKARCNVRVFKKHGLYGMLSNLFNASPYIALDVAYPNTFRPWELKKAPHKYWTKETAVEAIKWLAEEKLGHLDTSVRPRLTQEIFKSHGLWGMLYIVFDGNIHNALKTAYPNTASDTQHTKSVFRTTPNHCQKMTSHVTI